MRSFQYELFPASRFVVPDERDWAIANQMLTRRAQLTGFLLGDWVQLSENVYLRISVDWGEEVSLTYFGSFFLLETGEATYPGNSTEKVLKSRLRTSNLTKEGNFIFSHHNLNTGSNHVGVKVKNLPVHLLRL